MRTTWNRTSRGLKKKREDEAPEHGGDRSGDVGALMGLAEDFVNGCGDELLDQLLVVYKRRGCNFVPGMSLALVITVTKSQRLMIQL